MDSHPEADSPRAGWLNLIVLVAAWNMMKFIINGTVSVVLLRRDSPLVPDWLYWILRPRTEAEMTDGAKTIADQVRFRDGETK